MKLHRFTALNNHRAILIVHDKLGPDALIYSTRRIANGIEVLAGIPGETNDDDENEVPVEKTNIDRESLDKLNLQLQAMEESIQRLSAHILTLYQVMQAQEEQKKNKSWKTFLKNLTRFKKQPVAEVKYVKQPVI